MIGASHIAAGAAVGVALKEPWLAFPTAFAIHYLLDMIPHHEYLPPEELRDSSFKNDVQTLGKATIDAIVGFSAVAIITKFNLITLAAGFSGALPDILSGIGFTLTRGGTVKPHSLLGRIFAAQKRFHKFIHLWKRPHAAPLWRAIINQALPMFILLWAAFRYFGAP